MTHRVFSRNAASSRAIPVKKLIKDVMENPFIPVVWGKNQKGMQSTEDCTNVVRIDRFLKDGHRYRFIAEDVDNVTAWLHARDFAVKMAERFDEAGYHKQIVNRILEPFAHITVLVTSTEWSNFLALRDHKDAEPHIAILARQVKNCLYSKDNIQDLVPGQWHMPFITEGERRLYNIETLQKLSTARCASTSYKTVDGFDMTPERAGELYDKLVTADLLHASPMEHVCQADEWMTQWVNKKKHGNLNGFIQLRKTLPNENIEFDLDLAA